MVIRVEAYTTVGVALINQRTMPLVRTTNLVDRDSKVGSLGLKKQNKHATQLESPHVKTSHLCEYNTVVLCQHFRSTVACLSNGSPGT